MLEKNMNSILVTGGSGLVGQFLKQIMPDAVYLSSKDCDLTNQKQVSDLFENIKPKKVIHLAARVGGITENIKYPAEFFDQNVLMNTFVVQNSYKHRVDYCLSILSTCIYPDVVSQYPMIEKDLFAGPPAPTNFSYAYSKRALAAQINAYNKQYGTNYNYLIPCNLYGEYDKFDDNAHYVSALIKKIHSAAKNKTDVEIFGDGTPLRQFMYAGDLAKIIKYFIDNNIKESCNVSNNENYSIEKIAKIGLECTDNQNLQLIFNKDKPNGQYRKDVSNKKLLEIIGNFEFTPLNFGIKKVYNYYDQISKRYD